MSQTVEPSKQESQEQQESQQPARSKLVQRLLDASSSLPAFVKDLLTTQAVVVAGPEACAFLVENQGEQVGLRVLHHIRPDESDQETRQNAVKAFQNIVVPCVQQRKDGAIEVGSFDGGDAQFCLVTVLRSEGQVVAVSAVITRCRDMDRAKQRLQSMQLVAGYFELFSLRRHTEQAKMMADRHQHVLQYAGAVATAEGFESAAMGLCNELATRAGASRVSLGWMKGRNIKVRALSHTEKFDKKQELVVLIQKVMEECVDQEEPVKFDPDGQSTANVTRAARELAVNQGGNIVLSVPLRRRDEIVGVLTVEWPPRTRIDESTEAAVGVAAEIISPQLFDRHENDRFIWVKIGHSIRDGAKLAIGPKHMLVKAIVVGVIGLIAFAALYQPMYRVKAPFQLVAREKQVLSAPFEGIVESVKFRPGERVPAGAVIATLRTFELQQKLNESQAEQLRSEQEAAIALNDPKKLLDREVALLKAREAQERVKLYQYYIQQASITAPFDCIILRGDLWDKVGAPLKQGEMMFEVAKSNPDQPGKVAVEAEMLVSERDIQEVKHVVQKPHRDEHTVDGKISTTSFPNLDNKMTITRIVPVGEPKEGENVFKVYAEVKDPAPWMYPGLAGEARVDVEQRRFAWIWTHRLTDWLKLKLWQLPSVGY